MNLQILDFSYLLVCFSGGLGRSKLVRKGAHDALFPMVVYTI